MLRKFVFDFLLDAQYYTFGSSYVTNNPTLDLSVNLLTTSDIVILPQSTVTIAGRIGSVQFYSSSAGTINIYVNNFLLRINSNIFSFVVTSSYLYIINNLLL